MIGIWLIAQKDAFIEFVNHHILPFEEILDPEDLVSLKKYDAIVTDDKTFVAVDVKVEYAKDESHLVEILQQYVVLNQDASFTKASTLAFAANRVISELAVSLTFPKIIPTAEKVEQSQSIRIADYQPLSTTKQEESMGDLEDLPVQEEPEPEAEPELEPMFETKSSQSISFGQAVQSVMPNVSNIFEETSEMPLVSRKRERMVTRSHTAQKMNVRGTGSKKFGAPIITFSSLTDKAGVSSVAFMFAKMLAIQDPLKNILYLDLNISNPNSILNTLQLDPNTDASVVKIAAESEIDFVSNISLMTETIAAADCSLSLITFGEATLSQKSKLVKVDFRQMIQALSNCFDTVIVDLGRFMTTMPYQMAAFEMTSAKHVLVADGSSLRITTTFINQFRELPYHFEIVVNKYLPNVGTFMFNKQLKIAPIGTVTVHRNLDAIMCERIPFEGTALHNQLIEIGGML